MDKDIHHSKKNQASGLSTVRVLKYATCMTKILNSIDIETAGRKEIESFVLSLKVGTPK